MGRLVKLQYGSWVRCNDLMYCFNPTIKGKNWKIIFPKNQCIPLLCVKKISESPQYCLQMILSSMAEHRCKLSFNIYPLIGQCVEDFYDSESGTKIPYTCYIWHVDIRSIGFHDYISSESQQEKCPRKNKVWQFPLNPSPKSLSRSKRKLAKALSSSVTEK